MISCISVWTANQVTLVCHDSEHCSAFEAIVSMPSQWIGTQSCNTNKSIQRNLLMSWLFEWSEPSSARVVKFELCVCLSLGWFSSERIRRTGPKFEAKVLARAGWFQWTPIHHFAPIYNFNLLIFLVYFSSGPQRKWAVRIIFCDFRIKYFGW